MRKICLLLAIVISFSLLYGCFQNASGPSKFSKNWAKEIKTSKQAIYKLDPNKDTCKQGTCVCMVCQNKSTYFTFQEGSLAGGNCYFKEKCTLDEFIHITSDDAHPANTKNPSKPCTDSTSEKNCNRNFYVRQFMFGTGTTFSDFSRANAYCGGRLNMAVQWLPGSHYDPYPIPDRNRSECFLGKDVMPLYVLYSGGVYRDKWGQRKEDPLALGLLSAPDQSKRAGKIAKELKKAGPVIITTEMDPNKSRKDLNKLVDEIYWQVINMDKECGNVRTGNDKSKWKVYCQIALGVNLGDEDTLKKLKTKLGNDFKKVDLVAFGINNRYFDHCNSDVMWDHAREFARNVSERYGKPTVIPYVLFDAAHKIPHPTDKLKYSCQWSEKDLTSAYLKIADYALPLRDAGVIGIAPYDFGSTLNGFSNPLNCEDCRLDKNNVRLSSWYGFCQIWAAQYDDKRRLPDSIMPIRFGSTAATNCDETTGGSFLTRMTFTSGTALKNFHAGKVKPISKVDKTLVSCDACLNENLNWPFQKTWMNNKQGQPPIPIKNPGMNKDLACAKPTAFKTSAEQNESIAFDVFGSYFNLDPMILRAVAVKESRMQQCAAAKVYPNKGIDQGCYPKGYDYIIDSDITPKCAGKANAAGKIGGQPEFRYCGLGIMQSLEPPYTYWPRDFYPLNEPEDVVKLDGDHYSGKSPGALVYGAQLYLEAKNAGRGANLKAAAMCNPYFNPFNMSDSICVGAYKLSQNYQTGLRLVRYAEECGRGDRSGCFGIHSIGKEGEEILGTIKGGAPDHNKRRVMAMYFALHLYRGRGGSDVMGEPLIQKWLRQYYQSWAAWKTKDTYCIPDSGGLYPPGCSGKGTLTPDPCTGHQEFPAWFNDCVVVANKNNKINNDYAAEILGYYRWMTATKDDNGKSRQPGCDNSFCPSWKRLNDNMCQNDPAGGYPNPYGTSTTPSGDKCVRKISKDT